MLLRSVCFQAPFSQPIRRICSSTLENGIKKITMDSPKTRNSLSLEMLQKLEVELNADRKTLDLRCIVIRDGKLID